MKKEKKIFLTRFSSLTHWKIKQLWLWALWEKLSPWDCDLEGDGGCCLLIQPWVWAEVPAGKPRVRWLFNISCQIFFMGLLLAVSYRQYRLAEALGSFGNQLGNSWVSKLPRVSAYFCSLYSGTRILI